MACWQQVEYAAALSQTCEQGSEEFELADLLVERWLEHCLEMVPGCGARSGQAAAYLDLVSAGPGSGHSLDVVDRTAAGAVGAAFLVVAAVDSGVRIPVVVAGTAGPAEGSAVGDRNLGTGVLDAAGTALAQTDPAGDGAGILVEEQSLVADLEPG